MNNTKEPSPRERSIAYFALFAAWFLAVAFRGSTLHAFWAQKGVLPGDAFEDWSILANVAGLVLAGFLCTSPARSRQVMTLPWPFALERLCCASAGSVDITAAMVILHAGGVAIAAGV